jgi:hypothetical protein
VSAEESLDGDGGVQSTRSDGNDPTTGAFLEQDVRAWAFPAKAAETTVDIPLRFVRH